MESTENIGKRNGLITTVIVHVFVIILLCFLGLDIIDPKPGGLEASWEIEGVENAGGETNDDATAEKVSQDQQFAKSTPTPTSTPTTSEDLISDPNSDVTVKQTPDKTKTPPQETNITQKNTPTDEPTKDPVKENDFGAIDNLFNQTSKAGPNTDGGTGKGPQPGKQGGKVGTGGEKGTGKGIGGGRYDLGGRAALKIGKFQNDCQKTGTVNVWVKINRKGEVVDAIDRGGTTQDGCLVKLAIQQAKSIKYTPTASGPLYNEGIIKVQLGLN